MAYSFHELKLKTIQELREIAKDVQHEATPTNIWQSSESIRRRSAKRTIINC